jgi:hypothetical protein
MGVNSLDGNDTVSVDEFGMKESCFCRGLWAFVLCFEKDAFIIFWDIRAGSGKDFAHLVQNGLFGQTNITL